MRLQIKQTKANLAHEYAVSSEDRILYSAKASRVSRLLGCSLFDAGDHEILRASYDMALNLKNAVPFRWLAGSPKISKACKITAGEETEGAFALATEGLFRSRYVIAFKDMALNGYAVSKGDANYVALFDALKDKQVGLLVKPLDVDDNLDAYTLYLLDSAGCAPEALCLFVVYYDSWNYGNRAELAFGKREISREWTFSRYNRKYDPNWLAEHFPALHYVPIRKS